MRRKPSPSATRCAPISWSVLTPDFEERLYRSGVAHDDEFAHGLVDKGLFAPQGSAIEVQLLKEEMMRFDAPVYLSETSRMVASVIRQAGTQEMQERIVPGAMNGDITIALGFTEPECGSDVAAAKTKAVRSGDGWLINGSKMFTTNGHIADYVFLLARTNPEKPKHKGLTMFLVPLDAEGVEVQAVWTLSGERTNITFYSDVRIGDECRIGEVDGGWGVLGISLQDEHASGWGPHLERLLDHAEQWAHSCTDDAGSLRIADSDVRRRLARMAIEAEVSTPAPAAVRLDDRAGPDSSRRGPDVQAVQHRVAGRAAQDVNEFVGPDALRSYFEPTAPQNGRFEHLTAVLTRHDDLRGHQRGSAHHHRPARSRSTPLAS